MTKFNKSRRSIANDRVNAFLNNKSVGIKAVNISEAGNIEIKFIAWYLSSAQLKLRVNLTTLTYVFEHYGTRNQQGIRGVTTKRKAIDTMPDGNKNFFEHEMLAFLEETMLSTRSKINDTFKDMYMVQWGDPMADLTPPVAPDFLIESVKAERKSKYDAMQHAHVMYAKMAIDESVINKMAARHPMSAAEIELAREEKYQQLLRERDNTPLFSDEQYERWIEGKGQPNKMDGQPVVVGVAHKLTDDEIKSLYDDAQRPYNNKLHEIISNMQADGSVTVTIDMTKENVTLVDEVETVRIQVNKPKKGD